MPDLELGVLYERFVAARQKAIELTDSFSGVAVNDSGRAELWRRAMHQTEFSRLLLERWLRSG